MKPLLRWAGGKQRLVSTLIQYVPDRFNRYFEPFFGAGSLYATLVPETAFLTDLNQQLIGLYRGLQDNAWIIAKHLRKHAINNSASYYYQVRKDYNRIGRLSSTTQAARFLYLNRTCFNGIFRVNKQGEFNVPYGHLQNPIFPHDEELMEWGARLARVQVAVKDFEVATKTATEGDFVYLDPPYPPLNGTSFFHHYTSERFSMADHERVASCMKSLDRRGAMVMVTNADLPHIRKLYEGFNIYDLEVTRNISCKKKKTKVSELVITNY